MIFPAWAFFGLMAAALSALMMLLQERFKIDGYALAFWNKVVCAAVMTPFIFIHGLPQDPLFYVFLGLGAVMYCVSDVVFFRSIPKVGAGVISRILPVSVILSFLLWFAVNPALLPKYLAAPVESGLIFLTLCLSVYFSMRLRQCAVSMQAVRVIWLVIVAATLGPVLAKTVTTHADMGQGPYAYVFVEALMMMTLWTVWFAAARPVSAGVLLARRSILGGLVIGTVMAFMVLVNIMAYYHIDNPAYIPAVKFIDSIIILAAHRLQGQRSSSDLVAGFGIVACAAALIILKAQVP